MAVDTKVGKRSPDAGKEQHSGVGTSAKAAEAKHPNGPGGGDVFKKHRPANTNDNAPSGLIPDLCEG